MEKLFLFENVVYYFFGFMGFVATSCTLVFDSKRKHKWLYLFQDFIYTTLAVALGVAGCYALETSTSVAKITAIIMGIVGPTIIRRIKREENYLADSVVNNLKSKITTK